MRDIVRPLEVQYNIHMFSFELVRYHFSIAFLNRKKQRKQMLIKLMRISFIGRDKDWGKCVILNIYTVGYF